MDEFEKDLNEQQDLPETDAPEQAAAEADVQAAAPAVPEADKVPEPDVQPEPLDAQADAVTEETEAVAEEVDAVAEEAEAAAEEAEAVAEEAETAAEETAKAADEAAEEAAAEDAPEAMSPTGEDALVQELEGIRDLLQQELDNAGSGELIQGLDEIPEEEDRPEEIPEEERCQCCGEQRRDTSFGEDYPYCADCRALMKAAPIKWTSVLCWIVMLAVAAASMLVCTGAITDYATLMEAETYYANRQIVDAEATYYNYLSSAQYNENHSRAAVRNLIDIFSSKGYLSDANDLITQNFTDAQRRLHRNSRRFPLPLKRSASSCRM